MGTTDERDQIEINEQNDGRRNKLVFTAKAQDQEFEFEQLGITFDSSENEILNALQGVIQEANISVEDDEREDEYIFTVRKSTNTQMIYVLPKDPAGN